MKHSKLAGMGAGLILVGGALGIPLLQGAATAYAQSPTTTPTAQATPQPGQQPPAQGQPPRQGEMTKLMDTFWSALATNLNTTTDNLKTQIAAAQKSAIEQAVTDGTLTRAQADAMEQRMSQSNSNMPFFGFGFGGPRGGPRGRFGPGGPNGQQGQSNPNGQNAQPPQPGQNAQPGQNGQRPGFGFRGGPGGNVNTLEAVATALNLKPADLVSQLQSGKTLTDIITAQNVDQTVVKQAIVDARKTEIQRQVTDGLLTQDQANQILTNLTVANVDLTHLGFGMGMR